MLQRDALFYNAGAEIGIGFYLVVMLLTPRRAVMNTFAYWHWLRMRYASPDSSAYQSMVRNAMLCATFVVSMLAQALQAHNGILGSFALFAVDLLSGAEQLRYTQLHMHIECMPEPAFANMWPRHGMPELI